MLYPLPLRDTLLYVAEAGLYEARWSERILDEVERNLVAHGRSTPEKFARLRSALGREFAQSSVPQTRIDVREPFIANDAKDRHVLAAAVVARGDAVVTLNLRDFPEPACRAVGVKPVHPDAFLLRLYARAPRDVHAAVERQAAALRRPPMTLGALLDRLAVDAPRFAKAIREHQEPARAPRPRLTVVEPARPAERRPTAQVTARDRGVSR